MKSAPLANAYNEAPTDVRKAASRCLRKVDFDRVDTPGSVLRARSALLNAVTEEILNDRKLRTGTR